MSSPVASTYSGLALASQWIDQYSLQAGGLLFDCPQPSCCPWSASCTLPVLRWPIRACNTTECQCGIFGYSCSTLILASTFDLDLWGYDLDFQSRAHLSIVFFCVVVHFFWLANVCFCCVVFFHTKPTDWLGETSPKWPILCRVGRKTTTQSIPATCGHRVMTHTHAKLQVRAKSVQKMDWKQRDTIDRITTAFPALLLAMTCHFRLLNCMSSIFTWSKTRLFGHAFYSLRSQNSIKVSLC